MAFNGRTAVLPGIRPSRRTFLLGASMIAAAPVIDACTFSKPGPMMQLYGRGEAALVASTAAPNSWAGSRLRPLP